MKKSITIFISIILVIVLASFVKGPAKAGKYDEFAKCLGDKEALFYGAFWCTHCQAQKKMFGKSAKLLPYVECSTADGRDQTEICKEKKIEAYPTWIFSDGSRLSGEIALERLAEKTSCALPALE
jgi:thiol-disulfide isomerase/thioredoxin